MTNPSKDPKFNETLRRMLDAKPKQNTEIKKPRVAKPKPDKPRDPWQA